MKKLLSLLATISLVSTSTASIVACGNQNDNLDDDLDGDPIDENVYLNNVLTTTYVGGVRFYSQTGNDDHTIEELWERITVANPDIHVDSIFTISNINRKSDEAGTALVEIEGMIGSVTVSFTILSNLEIIAEDIVPEGFNGRVTSQIQTDDNTVLFAGGIDGVGNGAFISSLDLITNEVTSHLLDPVANIINCIYVLQDGRALISYNGISILDLDENYNPRLTQVVPQTQFPGVITSTMQLADGTIFVAGEMPSNQTSFVRTVDLENGVANQLIGDWDMIFLDTTIPGRVNGLISNPNSFWPQVATGNFAVTIGGSPNSATVGFLNNFHTPMSMYQWSPLTFPSNYIINTLNILSDGRVIVTGGSNSDENFLHEIAINSGGSGFNTFAVYISELPESTITSIIELKNGRLIAIAGEGTQSKMFNIYI